VRLKFSTQVPLAGLLGKPGRGGGGCRCSNYSWDVESCHTDEEGERICSRDSYTCSNGSDGRDGILFKSHYVRGEERDQFVITQAFFPLDLKHLELSQPTGREEELSIEITDHMGLNLIVQNKFTVELKFKRWLGYYETEFYGTLKPEDFVMTEIKSSSRWGNSKMCGPKNSKRKERFQSRLISLALMKVEAFQRI
jgi:hypothetical protein